MAAEGTSVDEDHAVAGHVAPEVLLDDALNVFVGTPAVGDTQVVIEHLLRGALAQLFQPALLLRPACPIIGGLPIKCYGCAT
jgi:hypothetical protein